MSSKKVKVISLVNTRGYRAVYHSSPKPRIFKVSIRLSIEVRDKLEKVWKSRTYPHPQKSDFMIKFRSLNDYLEFCIVCLNQAGPHSWYLFSNILNPNFRED